MFFLGVIVTKSSIIDYHACKRDLVTEQELISCPVEKFEVAIKVFVDMGRKLMLHS